MTSSEFSVEGTASVKDEMAPCPFCGETEHLSMDGVGSLVANMPDRPYRVVCRHIDHDSVEGPVAYGKWAAREAWNRRAAAPSRDQVPMGALREALEIARQELGLVFAFIGRDKGTDRMDKTLDGLHERTVKAEAAIRDVLAALVPTAEQGVGLVYRLTTAVMVWATPHLKHTVSYNVLKEAIEAALATPPIAGAGEEPLARAADALEDAIARRHYLVDAGRALISRAREAAASISQLYSRIGELEADNERACHAIDTAVSEATEWREQCTAAEAAREAAEAKLAEAQGLIDRIPAAINSAFMAGGEEREGGSANRQERYMQPADALRNDARSFHSPKEPGQAGGGA